MTVSPTEPDRTDPRPGDPARELAVPGPWHATYETRSRAWAVFGSNGQLVACKLSFEDALLIAGCKPAPDKEG